MVKPKKCLKIRTIVLSMILAFTFLFSNGGTIAKADTMTQLNATQIVNSMGAGWNLGNSLEANINGIPSETSWGNPTVTQSLINAVKAAGFKTIRIPVSYLNYIGPGPNYTINASWLSRVKQVVDYCYNQGLYVIINIHGDGYNTISGSWLLCNGSDQATIKAKYQAVWRQIANTFVNYDQRLIFESMNEVFDGTWNTPNTSYYSNINDYNQIFVDTVRQTGGNNASRWLLIPGWNTNINYTAGNYGFRLPSDNYRSSTIPSSEKRIMISVHYYDPWDFCGDENSSITQWGATSTNPSKKSTWGQEDYMNSQLSSMYNKFVTQGYPVVIGEYGSIDKTSKDPASNTYRAEFAKQLCTYSKQYKCVPVVWDNGASDFRLFNRSNNSIAQAGIISAIMGVMGGNGGGSGIVVGSTYKIQNRTTGMYIDGMGNSTNGSNCGQWSASSSNNQRWVLEASGSYYKLKNVATGLYLDGMGRATAGSVCGQWGTSSSNNQKWTIVASGSYYKIKNVATGLVLDGGGNSTNGSDLKQWNDVSSTNLEWSFITP